MSPTLTADDSINTVTSWLRNPLEDGEGGMSEVYRAYNFIFLATKFLVNRLCSRVDSGNSDNAVAIRPAKILVPVTFRGTQVWSLLY